MRNILTAISICSLLMLSSLGFADTMQHWELSSDRCVVRFDLRSYEVIGEQRLEIKDYQLAGPFGSSGRSAVFVLKRGTIYVDLGNRRVDDGEPGTGPYFKVGTYTDDLRALNFELPSGPSHQLQRFTISVKGNGNVFAAEGLEFALEWMEVDANGDEHLQAGCCAAESH